jgi:hypothetical protein
MNNTGLLILAIIVALFYKGSQENEETWEVNRDERGKLVGITVHRKVRNNLTNR